MPEKRINQWKTDLYCKFTLVYNLPIGLSPFNFIVITLKYLIAVHFLIENRGKFNKETKIYYHSVNEETEQAVRA